MNKMCGLRKKSRNTVFEYETNVPDQKRIRITKSSVQAHAFRKRRLNTLRLNKH